jgi:hypothetical protein
MGGGGEPWIMNGRAINYSLSGQEGVQEKLNFLG